MMNIKKLKDFLMARPVFVEYDFNTDVFEFDRLLDEESK